MNLWTQPAYTRAWPFVIAVLAAILILPTGNEFVLRAATGVHPRNANRRTRIYYLSPNGRDAGDGTSEHPWQTFAHALAVLKPGDTLYLKSGIYRRLVNGLPRINCAQDGNARNGRPDQPIVIRAEAERQAFIDGDGNMSPFQVENCSHWSIIGIHIENGDYSNEADGRSNSGASVMYLNNDDHLVVRRNILARDNRYFNSMLIEAYKTSNTLYEENEFYYFHRHAINSNYGVHNIFRRNYCNSRFYQDLSDCSPDYVPGIPRCSEWDTQDRGDSCISLYPDRDSIIENNIGENNEDLLNIEAAYASYGAENERFYGNISLKDIYGILHHARGNSDAYTYHQTYHENDAIIYPIRVGIYWRGPGSIVGNHITIVGSTTSDNFIADHESTNTGAGTYVVHIQNSLSINAVRKRAYGFAILKGSGGKWLWSMDHVNAFNNSINFEPELPNDGIRYSGTHDPVLDNCLVWIPKNSPMKGAASDRGDIGANVLYEYENGTLTSTPLWDPATGEFPHGSLVRGLNDVSGQSAFDVNKRLHVSYAGCTLPSDYAPAGHRDR